MRYRLFSYRDTIDGVNTGLVVGEEQHWDLALLSRAAGKPVIGAMSVDELLENWALAHGELKSLAQRACGPEAPRKAKLDVQTIRFAPPLCRPGAIYAAGANYRDHVEAMARALNLKLEQDPRSAGVPPWHFLKAGRTTLAAHGQSVMHPEHTQKLDWEAELAVVIGQPASRVSVAQSLEFVAGYSCANDLSARDNLRRDRVDASSPFRFDWLGHKCFPGSCPIGPYLTPAEFAGDPENLAIKLWRNDELRQDSNTSNHLYGVAEQISYLSQRIGLYPGDIILTGTPAGVGAESGQFLSRGDVLRVWIEGLGELRTAIV